MAEDFLEEIYAEAKLTCEIRQVVEYAKSNNRMRLNQKGNALLGRLMDWCKRYAAQDGAGGVVLWKHIKSLIGMGDPILIGDVLEQNILPLVEKSMRQWGDIHTENDEGDYLFTSTVSGFLTIKDLREDRYLHSAVDPMWEARQQAKAIYDPRDGQHCVRGCGLGYLIYQLYEVSYGSASIQVLEPDARMITYAQKYGVLDWVPKENLDIIVEP